MAPYTTPAGIRSSAEVGLRGPQLVEAVVPQDSALITAAEARVARAMDRKARADQAIVDAAITAPRP
jgi:hypothetical protein